jgi:peptidoglycan hydrolase-like protein with peptidoglycan-binding domain
VRSSSQAQARGRRTRRDEEEETGGFPGSAWLAGAAQLAARRPLDTAGLTFATFGCLAILINALFLQSGSHPAPLIPFKPRPVTLSGATGGIAPADPVLPRPRPVATEAARPPAVAAIPVAPAAAPAAVDAKPKAELVIEIQKELARRSRYDGTADGIWGPKTIAAARDFVQHSNAKVAIEPNELLLRAIVRTPAKTPATTAAVAALVPAAPVAAAPVVPVRSAPVEAIAPPAPVPAGSRRLMAAQKALSDFGYGQIKPTGTDDAATRAAIQAFERERNLPVTGRLSDSVARELSTITGRALD